MKNAWFILILFVFVQVISAQEKSCPKNPDPLYDRNEVQQKFADNLNKTLFGGRTNFRVKNDQPWSFAVYDLNDPSNKSFGGKCVDFFDGHVYHFSSVIFDQSESSIAILESGKVKFFEKINCGDIDKKLKEVIDYAKQMPVKYNITGQVIQRIANYRRYGEWLDRYTRYRGCEVSTKLPDDKETSYSRLVVFKSLTSVLYGNIKPGEHGYYGIFPIENERGNGFYVQDLVDLENKQTNLLEFVHFKEEHVYQFGWIDAPYSNTHFIILKDGKIHTFEAIDCKSKEAGINQLIDFIKENFKAENTEKELLERVGNYQRYRAIIEFQGKTEPKCISPN